MNVRTLTIGAAMVAVLVIILAFASGLNPWAAAKRANARAVTAETQSAVDTKTAAATADQAAKTVIIVREAQGAQNAVQQAQGADEPLSPAVRGSILSGVERLRHPAAAGDDQPSAGVPTGL